MNSLVHRTFTTSDIPYIVTKSLYNYDLYNIIVKLIKEYTKISIIPSKVNLKRDKFEFRFKDKKYESEVEILGIYYKNQNIWIWGWNHPQLSPHQVYNSKELLLYGLNLDHVSSSYIKQTLTTSRGKINDPIQIDIILAISLFLRKIKFIYPYEENHGEYTTITYYVLFNENIINELYDDIVTNL